MLKDSKGNDTVKAELSDLSSHQFEHTCEAHSIYSAHKRHREGHLSPDEELHEDLTA